MLCDACDHFYAEILPDRLLIYSFHFGKIHMSAFFAADMASVYEAARRGAFLKLECACGQLPCAVIQLGRMLIQSKHKLPGFGSQAHSNALTLEDIGEIYELIGGIIADDSNAPSLTEIRQAS